MIFLRWMASCCSGGASAGQYGISSSAVNGPGCWSCASSTWTSVGPSCTIRIPACRRPWILLSCLFGLRNLFERIRRLGLLCRRLLLGEKGDPRQQAKYCSQPIRNRSAQARRPGKLHLDRVPFHSAPHSRRSRSFSGFKPIFRSGRPYGEKTHAEAKLQVYRIRRAICGGKSRRQRPGVTQTSAKQYMGKDRRGLRPVPGNQRIDVSPDQPVSQIEPSEPRQRA